MFQQESGSKGLGLASKEQVLGSKVQELGSMGQVLGSMEQVLGSRLWEWVYRVPELGNKNLQASR